MNKIVENWSFIIAGVALLCYSGFLIHKRIEVGLGQAVLVVTALLLAALPFVSVRLGSDGTLEIKRYETVNVATQEAVHGVAELQKRIDALAAETERRLSALEKSSNSSEETPANGGVGLPAIANPPHVTVPAINESGDIVRDLQNSLDLWRDQRLK